MARLERSEHELFSRDQRLHAELATLAHSEGKAAGQYVLLREAVSVAVCKRGSVFETRFAIAGRPTTG